MRQKDAGINVRLVSAILRWLKTLFISVYMWTWQIIVQTRWVCCYLLVVC